MATAPSFISFLPGDTNGYKIPSSLTPTTTPQGGSAFKDASGNMYIKGTNGYTLAPQTLPGNSTALPAVSNGLDVNGNPTMAGTPTGGQNVTTPVATAGSTQVQVQPTMPTSVKTALETAANSEGNSLGSSVPVNPSRTSSTPTVDYTLHQGETVDQYNARVAQEQQAAGVSTPTTSTTTGTSTTPNINDYLGALGTAPTAPNLNADQTAEENTVGIPAIQTNIQNLTTQLQSAQAQALTDEGAEASKPGVVASVINGRIKMISAEDAVAITNLQNQIKDAQSQLTAANTVVSTYMKNDETNYQNASSAYEKAYTEAMAQYTDAEKQANLAQTTARANITALTASFKGKTGYTPSADDIANWNTLDLQAGFQPGTTAAIVQNDLNVSKFIKGSNGEEYAITTDANGNPQVVQIGYAGGTTTQANGTSGSVNGTGSGSDQKTIAAFEKSLGTPPATLDKPNGVTREQFARRLQAKYPNISSDDILSAVYNTYPDQ